MQFSFYSSKVRTGYFHYYTISNNSDYDSVRAVVFQYLETE